MPLFLIVRHRYNPQTEPDHILENEHCFSFQHARQIFVDIQLVITRLRGKSPDDDDPAAN